MKQCLKCKQTIYGKEFVCSSGSEIFCSAECFPEGVLDEPYAMNYVGLIEKFNEIEDKRWPINDYMERQDLLTEIDYFITQCEEYQLGDSESFYKQQLRKVHHEFLELQEKVWSCFMTKESLLRDTGYFIYWEGIKNEISLVAANEIKQLLENIINEEGYSVTIMYNQELDPSYDRNFVHVYGNEDYIEDEWKHPLLEKLYNASKSYLDSLTNSNVCFDDLFEYLEIANCPKCRCMEPWEDYGYDKRNNMLVCSGCSIG